MWIICGYPYPNPPLTRIQISFFHIRQYSYSYPYPKGRCGYRNGKSNILFVSDPISECCVLHNDIGMETIPQWNKALNFDILSWWKSNSGKYSILARAPQDILSIWTSTMAFESTFSTGGRVIYCYRSQMTMNTMNVLICTQ